MALRRTFARTPIFSLNFDSKRRPQIARVRTGLEATVGKPADINDLERLEDEIDQALIDLINKPADNKTTIADLRRRQTHLRDEIDCLRHGAADKVPQ